MGHPFSPPPEDLMQIYQLDTHKYKDVRKKSSNSGEVDGALVGGASIKLDQWMELIRIAETK